MVARELAVGSEWRKDVTATCWRSGPVYVLVSVRKIACDTCRYGVRFDTVWGSAAGECHRITWCQSCFNAECGATQPDREAEQFRAIQHHRLGARQPVRLWNGARAAVEDLERRGLL